MIELELDINANMRHCWDPANIAVVDESLVPHKGRKNPHHVLIIQKPHPHGLKNWSLVDFSGYFFGYSLFCYDKTGAGLTYEALVMRGKRSKRWRSWNWQRKNRRFYCVAQNMNSANSIHSQKKASQFENARIEFSNLEISATFLFRWVTWWHPTSAATSPDDVIAVG